MVLIAAPKLPVVIGVKVGTANIGEYAIVRNLTRGGQLTGRLQGTDRSVNLNPAPGTQWENGDLLQAEVRGRIVGVQQQTINKRRAVFNITAATDTATDGVTL